tara:strand:+ start:598 stop:717 length:120 start_codon:yes stop_codon:yes gene_type:complete
VVVEVPVVPVPMLINKVRWQIVQVEMVVLVYHLTLLELQ